MSSTNNLPTIYIRCRRLNQTIFMHCKSNELLADVIYRISALVGVQPNQLHLYEHFATAERKQHVLQQLKLQSENETKLKKKLNNIPNWIPSNKSTTAVNSNDSNVIDEIPPLDETKKIRELGLDNDSLVYFVIQNDDGTWEPPPQQ